MDSDNPELRNIIISIKNRIVDNINNANIINSLILNENVKNPLYKNLEKIEISRRSVTALIDYIRNFLIRIANRANKRKLSDEDIYSLLIEMNSPITTPISENYDEFLEKFIEDEMKNKYGIICNYKLLDTIIQDILECIIEKVIFSWDGSDLITSVQVSDLLRILQFSLTE